MKGNASEKELDENESPLFFAAVLAKDGTRWMPTHCLPSAEKTWFTQISAGLAKLNANMPTSATGPVLVGFAVLQSWSLCVAAVGDLEEAMLSKLRGDSRQMFSFVFTQHRDKAVVRLYKPLVIDGKAPAACRWWMYCNAPPIEEFVVETGERFAHSGGIQIPFDKFRGQCSSPLVHWWPSSGLVAMALASGVLTSDFAVICQRKTRSSHWTPPLFLGIRQTTSRSFTSPPGCVMTLQVLGSSSCSAPSV